MAMTQFPKSKWVAGSAPEDAVSCVAQQALEERLQLVWHYLPLAAEQAEEDDEYVHQLRVATRRAAAALDLFREVLPEKRSKWMHRKLRRVRSSAGAARDLDVLASRLASSSADAKKAPLREVLDAVAEERAREQDPIQEAYHLLDKRGYEKRVAKLVKRIRWRGEGPEPNLAEAARAALAPIGEEFFQAGSADMTQAENLHQFRISAKHLRYAMELLAGAFDQELRKELYPQVENIQERLGKVNDHATAARQYRCWKERLPEKPADLLGQLAAQEDTAFHREAQSFREWWTPERRDKFQTRLHALLDGS